MVMVVVLVTIVVGRAMVGCVMVGRAVVMTGVESGTVRMHVIMSAAHGHQPRTAT